MKKSKLLSKTGRITSERYDEASRWDNVYDYDSKNDAFQFEHVILERLIAEPSILINTLAMFAGSILCSYLSPFNDIELQGPSHRYHLCIDENTHFMQYWTAYGFYFRFRGWFFLYNFPDILSICTLFCSLKLQQNNFTSNFAFKLPENRKFQNSFARIYQYPSLNSAIYQFSRCWLCSVSVAGSF